MVEDITPRELLGARLIGYSLGDFGISLVNILIGTFIFQFYVYTINLNSLLVSVGISLQLIIGAIFSVIFGVIVDNKKHGRFGKRRPFLLFGLPVWFTASILIWFPPWYAPPLNSIFWPTAIYFWFMLIIKAISGTLIFNVYISMLPEQSQTKKNREKVASLKTAFIIIASIIALMLPLIIESFLEDPENVKWWQPSGDTILFYMPLIAICFAIFGLITIIFTFFSVEESFNNNFSKNKHQHFSVKLAFKQMIVPAKDKMYRRFLSVRFFNSIAGKTLGILVIPFLTFVLKFRETDFYFYILISFIGKFLWFFIWKKVIRSKNLIKSYSICLSSAVIVSLMELIFLFELPSFEFKIALFVIIIGTLLGAMYAFPLFSLPLGASLIHEAAVNKDKDNVDLAISNITGAYHGLLTFVASTGQSITSIILGFLLVGPNERNPVIITIALSTMGIFYLISLTSIRRIRLKEKITEFEIKDSDLSYV